MIEIKIFEVNPFQENTYLLYDESKECVIIDAGIYSEAEKKEISDFIAQKGLKPVKLLNTHCHVDHVFGNSFIYEKYSPEVLYHQGETPIIENVKSHGAVYGFDMEIPPLAKKFLSDGDEVLFGNSTLRALHVPGHSPGSIVFYSCKQKFIIAGDVLFYGSIGRTDLPGGNYQTLISGITEKLLTLDDDVVVYCGHGPKTNIGFERKNNPFLTR